MRKYLVIFAIVLFLKINLAYTCTRVVYLGPQETIITARSMDWPRDIGTNIWVLPRGIKRDGAAGKNTLKWTSKHGSIVSSVFDAATADGMNEKGLVANLLYLVESSYPQPGKNEKRLPMSISLWAQYMLDNFASVTEAVQSVSKENFYIVPVNTPDGEPGTVHLALSDASGDSAIFEYLNGKLVIHHGREFQVMTNSPSYDQQLALDSYWQQIGGATMLPGTSRAADRFARASYYIKITPQTSHAHDAITGVLSVIRNVSTPMGVSLPNQPNIAPTLWRTLSDQKNKRYYFESTKSPSIFWIDLADLDFQAGKPTKKLALSKNTFLAGNSNHKLVDSQPFKFLAAPVK
jgi:choloylglycine hydrolase